VSVTIEAGPRNAYADPESGLRYYRWQGRDLPSVTSIRRMAGVPLGLASWQLRRVVDRAVGEYDELGRMLTREPRRRERAVERNRREEAARWLRAASTEERDAAAALGTVVHDVAAAGMTPSDVPDVVTLRRAGRDIEVDGAEVRPRLAQYLDWRRVSEAQVLLAERQVWHLSIGYAGTFDLLCRLPSGRTSLVDIKTGGGLYGEHLLQLMAYLMAEHVGEDDTVNEAATAVLRSVDAVGILHIARDSWEFVFPRVDELAPAWRAFRGLHAFAAWTAAHAEAASWIETKRRGTVVLEEAS
jgi:hypothetical protein